MGLTNAQVFVLFLSVSMAIGRFSYGYLFPHTTKTVVVGGSEKWRFGYDYVLWASLNLPFYVNDTLVFKYDPPSKTKTRPHSVYLLPDDQSFATCNLTNAKLVANEAQGAGDGFVFVLKDWHPYFFACGGGNGFHCNNGTMKFVVIPLIPVANR